MGGISSILEYDAWDGDQRQQIWKEPSMRRQMARMEAIILSMTAEGKSRIRSS